MDFINWFQRERKRDGGYYIADKLARRSVLFPRINYLWTLSLTGIAFHLDDRDPLLSRLSFPFHSLLSFIPALSALESSPPSFAHSNDPFKSEMKAR